MNLRARLVLLAVVPVLLVTLILGYYITSVRIDDIRSEMVQRGEALAKGLLPIAEFGLFSGNETVLRNACDAALREADMLSVAVTDSNNALIWHAYNPQYMHIDRNDEGVIRFRQAVYRSGVNVSDFAIDDGHAADEKTVIGWVELALSTENLVERQRDELLNALVIVCVGLFVSLMLALRMGQGVAIPLMALTQALQRMTHGELKTRVREDSSGELLSLQRGVNAMAESLERAHGELQKRVTDATKELQSTVQELENKNTELEIARRQALLASKAKTDFLAKMSHEIRTPVNAILGFTRLLQKNISSDTESIEYAQTVTRAAEQLLCIINDILDFSKLEFGDVQLEHIDFDVRDCMEDVVSMFGPTVHEKGLELVLLVDSDVPLKLVGDPTRFNQIFSNLLNNAIKFTTTGGVITQLSLVEDLDDEVVLKVEVEDTGIGLSPVEQRGLFKAFSQADTTITRRFGGTGLGLSIARRFTELMGGQIGVRSEPGMGATFWFTVHLDKQRSPRPELDASAFRQRNVLLYDAHPMSRRAVRNTLVGWQMRVFNSGDPTRVVQMLDLASHRDSSPDLLVLGLSVEETQAAVLLSFMGSIREFYQGPILMQVNLEEFALPAPLQEDENLLHISKPARRQRIYRSISRLLHKEIYEEDGVSAATPLDEYVDLSALNVLVADDNEFNLMLVTTLLRQRGVNVIEAHDGQSAVNQFNKQAVDLIFMDIHMPGMDGIEASRLIREQSVRKHVPIVALTADVFADHEQRLLRAGMDDVLFKPITEEYLWRTIYKWIGGEQLSVVSKPVSVMDVMLDSPFSGVPEALLPRLLQELPYYAELARQALEKEDMDELYQHIHKLNGMVGYFALRSLQAEVKLLEAQLLEGNYDGLPEKIAMLQNNITELLRQKEQGEH